MDYRLCLDMGTNSIGWCLLNLEDGRPSGIEDAGVRIYSDGRDPKTQTPNAVARREARSARRRHDRHLGRRRRLIDALVKHSLMPKDEKARTALTALDPYEIRARGLDERYFICINVEVLRATGKPTLAKTLTVLLIRLLQK